MKLLRVIPMALATLCMLFFPGLLEARDATSSAMIYESTIAGDSNTKGVSNTTHDSDTERDRDTDEESKPAKSELLKEDALSEVFTASEVSVSDAGRVNGFVFQITIEGTLDADWLEKQVD